MLTHFKLGGTHEIADVFDNHHVQILGRVLVAQGVNAPGDHAGVEMAGAARVDGDDGDTVLAEAIGIEFGGHIAFDYRDAEVIGEAGEGFFQQGGFARAGATHQVQAGDAPGVKMGAIVIRVFLVGVEEVDAEGVVDDLVHGFGCRWIAINFVGARHCGNHISDNSKAFFPQCLTPTRWVDGSEEFQVALVFPVGDVGVVVLPFLPFEIGVGAVHQRPHHGFAQRIAFEGVNGLLQGAG